MDKMFFNAEKMYTYIRGYAVGRNMTQTLNALGFARQKHKDQKRKSGEPYITHPLTMACHALSLGIDRDETIAAILLHDVVEDCGVTLEQLPVNDTVRHAVDLVSFRVMDGETKEIAMNRYYNEILTDKDATITKIIDRCHNVSSMAGTFSYDKLIDYIDETKKYVLPLLKKAKEEYPEYSNPLFALKYHIVSVNDAINETVAAYDSRKYQPATQISFTEEKADM